MSKNCKNIHQLFSSLEQHSFPFDKSKLPKNGIYILFENGENAYSTNRIVRVGTHTGENQLQSRLSQHFLRENKDRSIFRKNIGRAILNKENDNYIDKWEIDLTTRAAKEKYSHLIDSEKQKLIERKVTEYIQNNFSFVVFKVNSKIQRLNLESKIISTVSLCQNCKPSENWLGNFSTKEKIRKSGLWLVNELWKEPLSEFEMTELLQLIK